MKITEVKTYRLQYPLKEKFANSGGFSTSRRAHVVEVVTDNGLTGWGEGSGDVSRSAIEAHILGRSPFDYGAIWHALHESGVSPQAISGVDIALWDLMGKALVAVEINPAFASWIRLGGCPDAIVHGPTEIRLFAFVKHRQLPTQFPLTLLC